MSVNSPRTLLRHARRLALINFAPDCQTRVLLIALYLIAVTQSRNVQTMCLKSYNRRLPPRNTQDPLEPLPRAQRPGDCTLLLSKR